jgi:uncharacterized LabA/DUF88 family protein
MVTDNKYAILIDADNISYKYIKIILDEISLDGVATYKRIYGDWTNPALASWKELLLEHSIVPIQQYSYTTGKNATDACLIIDAMDILYSGRVDGFCIVSSDSDYTRLAARLRESAMTVIGMGERKTPKPFISACNQFKYLDILSAGTQGDKPTPGHAADHPEEKDITRPRTIIRAIESILSENSDEDGWVNISTIGSLLVKRYPDFDVRNYGYNKLSAFVKSLNQFEIKAHNIKGSNARNIFLREKKEPE